MTTIVDRILEVFQTQGTGAYFGELVTKTEHALQCAHLAERAGAKQDLVAAALLHDIGHLLHGFSEDIAERGIDGRHEEAGAKWLSGYFVPAVVDPVRLHVAAKRYRCTISPEYLNALSTASRQSFRLQGGPMTEEEVTQFQLEPHFQNALQLRDWDDAAKVAGLPVPGLNHYRACLASVLLSPEIE